MSLLLLTKSFSKPLKSTVHNSRKTSKRGVSEIIGAMILLGVTVAGGLLVFVVVQNSDQLTFVTAERQSLNPNVIPKLILSGYDTRDAVNLYNLPDIDNRSGPTSGVDSLCTVTTCANSGADTEFIILKVRNGSNIVVEITDITINEIDHIFDSDHSTPGQLLSSSTVPEEGEFIIISGTGTSGILQEPLSFLPEGSEKRIVIRLNDGILTDIPLNSKMRIVINSAVETTQLLLVPAGRLA